MEVVFHAVAEGENGADGMSKGCKDDSVSNKAIFDSGLISRTRSRGLAAEIASLVASNGAGRLDLGSSTTGKFGVEVHDAVHASSILSSTDRLFDC